MEYVLIYIGVIVAVIIVAILWGKFDPKIKAANARYEKKLSKNETTTKLTDEQKHWLGLVDIRVNAIPFNYLKEIYTIDSYGNEHFNEYKINEHRVPKDKIQEVAQSRVDGLLDIKNYIKTNGSEAQKFHYESSLKGAVLYASSIVSKRKQSKKEVIKQYEVNNEIPASIESPIEGYKILKRDMTGLLTYFKEMPNMERIYNEFTYSIRNGNSIKDYLNDAKVMDDHEVRSIVEKGFDVIAGFLNDMLEIQENSELRRDFNACKEATTILRAENISK